MNVTGNFISSLYIPCQGGVEVNKSVFRVCWVSSNERFESTLKEKHGLATKISGRGCNWLDLVSNPQTQYIVSLKFKSEKQKTLTLEKGCSIIPFAWIASSIGRATDS